jgi:hypothetical protein
MNDIFLRIAFTVHHFAEWPFTGCSFYRMSLL